MFQSALTEPWTFAFDYKRTTGPVIGRFLAGLRAQRVLGMRGSDGRVLVPPTGYDPVTSETLTEWVEVAAAGALVSWTWLPEATPHGWAMVRLDGADTALIHRLEVPDPSALAVGDRVRIRWATERSGTINDIACFEPDLA